MLLKLGQKDWPILLFALFIFCVKVPLLNIPIYWDESIYFVPEFFEKGLMVFRPGDYDPFSFHGHPPLFQIQIYLFSLLYPDPIIASHLAAVLNSVALILVGYGVIRKHAGREAALLTLLFYFYYPHIFAFASQVHPNTLMIVFALLAFDAHTQKHYSRYALWTTLAVMTRESALAFCLLPLALSSWKIMKGNKMWASWRELLAGSAAFIAFALFTLYNKFVSGSFVNHPYFLHRVDTGEVGIERFLRFFPYTLDALKMSTIEIVPIWMLPICAMILIFYFMDSKFKQLPKHALMVGHFAASSLVFLLFFFAYADTIVRDFAFVTFALCAFFAVAMARVLKAPHWRFLFVALIVAGSIKLHFLPNGPDTPIHSYIDNTAHLKQVADKIGEDFPDAQRIKVTWPGLMLFRSPLYGYLPRPYETTREKFEEAQVLLTSGVLSPWPVDNLPDPSIWKVKYKINAPKGIMESVVYEKR